MPNYNFKREATVYMYIGTKYYALPLEDISFSQNFKTKNYAKKTLHEPHRYFKDTSITEANAADFDLTMLLESSSTLDAVKDALLKYETGTSNIRTFDLFIKTPNSSWKLTKCIPTNSVFLIEKLRELRLQISGEASKLERFTGTIPTNDIVTGDSSFQVIHYFKVALGGSTLANVVSVSVELQNDTEWLKAENIHDALAVTSQSNTIYPTNFVLSGRTLAGSIRQYLTENSIGDAQTWAHNTSKNIEAGPALGSGYVFNIPTCTYTTRLGAGTVYQVSYDWRSNLDLSSSSTGLDNILTHT